MQTQERVGNKSQLIHFPQFLLALTAHNTLIKLVLLNVTVLIVESGFVQSCCVIHPLS